jgi:excisionase family DNA binding protein
MEEKLLTEKEFCQWLRISRSTALRWRRDGMPYIGRGRSIRYNKAEVKGWLSKQSQRKSSEVVA